jgi:hypothetical protein
MDAKTYAIKIIGTVVVSNCFALAYYGVRTRFRTLKQIQQDP